MIQAFDPRTGEPVGEPVPETTDAGVDAAVAAAVAAFPAWSAFGRRAEARAAGRRPLRQARRLTPLASCVT